MLCASVLAQVLRRASVQVNLEGFLLAWRVADAVSSLKETATLFLHQLIALILRELHRFLCAVPAHTKITVQRSTQVTTKCHILRQCDVM